jgi:hypothetical protein
MSILGIERLESTLETPAPDADATEAAGVLGAAGATGVAPGRFDGRAAADFAAITV